MSEGFIGFKALGWGAGALLAMAAIAPSANSQWNPLRLAKERSTREMQRPSLLKKTSYSTGGTTTTSTPATPTTTTTPVLPELTSVPSNFDVMSELVPYQMPGSSAPDFGAFRFLCAPGQILPDDPVVIPSRSPFQLIQCLLDIVQSCALPEEVATVHSETWVIELAFRQRRGARKG